MDSFFLLLLSELKEKKMMHFYMYNIWKKKKEERLNYNIKKRGEDTNKEGEY